MAIGTFSLYRTYMVANKYVLWLILLNAGFALGAALAAPRLSTWLHVTLSQQLLRMCHPDGAFSSVLARCIA